MQGMQGMSGRDARPHTFVPAQKGGTRAERDPQKGFNSRLVRNPRLGYLRIDIRNAHNEACREEILQGFLREPSLQYLVPLLRAELGPDAPLVTGDGFLSGGFPFDPGTPGTSARGAQQGSPLAAAAFAVVAQPAIRAADEALRREGGHAKFSHDDGELGGPPTHVNAVFATLQADLQRLALTVTLAKRRSTGLRARATGTRREVWCRSALELDQARNGQLS